MKTECNENLCVLGISWQIKSKIWTLARFSSLDWSDIILFLIEFIGMTLVPRTTQAASAQLNKSSARCIVHPRIAPSSLFCPRLNVGWFLIHFQSSTVCFHKSWGPTYRMCFLLQKDLLWCLSQCFLSKRFNINVAILHLHWKQENSVSQTFQEIWHNCYLETSSLKINS